ncbi:MAG: nucleoside-triphosphatase [Oscillospiraceae bacterium]|nr:nucleoside-triphosphatase [Oscillospiraceae bacterium]
MISEQKGVVRIFLTGFSGVGKSTILRETLTPYAGSVAGFAAQRLTGNSESERVGFRAVTLEGRFPSMQARYRPGMGGVFMLHSQRNTAALESVILEVESRIQSHDVKLVLLDEIGGIELTSKVFMGTLERIFSSGTPCFGVFKSKGNLERTARTFGLNDELYALHAQLKTRILTGGEIITVTEENRARVLDHLKVAAEKIIYSER